MTSKLPLPHWTSSPMGSAPPNSSVTTVSPTTSTRAWDWTCWRVKKEPPANV